MFSVIRNGFFSTLLFLTIIVIPVIGQEQNTRTYELEKFDQLFLEGAFKVELIQGKKESLVVKASDTRVFDHLHIRNNGGLLYIDHDRDFFDFSKVTLSLTFSSINSLHLHGGICLKTEGYVDLKNIKVLLEGGSKLDLKVKAEKVNIKNSGGLLCELSGVTDLLTVYISGAGHVDAEELRSEVVDFKIDGVGTGKVYAVDKLFAQISGAGKIKYKGDPKVIQNIDGLGAVKKIR